MFIQESFKNNKATLYLVSTPIGNLEDITLRALNILKKTEYIFCEDTRHTSLLLRHFELDFKKLYRYEKFNEEKAKDHILKLLQNNFDVCLVSDAGTPGISDPGYLVSRLAIENGFNVVSIPGASASLTALVSSGLIFEPYTFIGFLPRKKQEQLNFIKRYKLAKESLIIYEAPTRLLETLKNLYYILENRNLTIARELTKLNETFYRTTLYDAISNFEKILLKGEFVLIIEKGNDENIMKDLSLSEHILLYLKQGFTEKEAIKQVALDLNRPKKEIYKEYKIDEKE